MGISKWVDIGAAGLLDLLAPGEPITFKTLGDGKRKSIARLNCTLHGSLGEHEDALADLNGQGAGVFWMVNAGDLRGTKDSNVQHVRALFVDLDGAPLEPVNESPMAPHAVVESSAGRWHAYWRIADCPVELFKPYQQALARRFTTDPTVNNPARLMRLPGFAHNKAATPFLSRLVATNDYAPILLADFRDALGLLPYTETHETQETQESQVSTGDISVARFVPTGPGQHQRNSCVFALARHLKARVPNATKPELRAYVRQWYEVALPVIGTTCFSESWGDFIRAWGSVKHPEGQFMRNLLEGVDNDSLPAGVPDYYEVAALRLVRICGRLQREAGKEPFFLSARTAGEYLGLHFTSAASLLSALVADEVLTLVTRGGNKGRQASEYLMPSLHRDTETQETQETQVRVEARP